jgi:tetratricopeptide (TPR) repeat protein
MNGHYYYLPITTVSAEAAKSIHGFADELLSHGAGARIIFDAVAADPDCALAHAYAAALYLTQLTREGQRQAAPHNATALRLIDICSEREALSIQAIDAWAQGDERRAITLLRHVVECTPHDLVAAKLCQILELSIGDFDGMLRTSAMAAAVDERSGFALGLHAFALEQAGHAEVGLRFARRAVDLNPDCDPWAQHAVAHALLALGQPLEARAFLHGFSHSWDRCSSFMLTHNWWHLALIELELGNHKTALAIFDEHVWGVRKGHVQDQLNAIALLARLEMQDVEASWRWQDIAAHLEHRVTDRMSAFVDLHYLIALIASGRDEAAMELMTALQDHPVAGVLALAIMSHALHDYTDAAALIAPLRRELRELGGSNVQRELFEMLYFDSVARCRGVSSARRGEMHRVAA